MAANTMNHEPFASEVLGVLEVGPSGAVVVTTRALRTRSLAIGNIGEALHGDEVRAVEIEPGRARVLETLVRRARRLVGVVDGGGRWFLCDDDRFPRALRMDPVSASDESVCGVELVEMPSAAGAEVRLCRLFGQRASLRAEADAVLWREGIELDFYSVGTRIGELPATVARELEALRLRACSP